MKKKMIKYISWNDNDVLHLKDLKKAKVYYDMDGCYFYITFEPFYYQYCFDLYYIDRIFGIGTIGKEYRFNGEYNTRRTELSNLQVGEDVIKYVESEISRMIKENKYDTGD